MNSCSSTSAAVLLLALAPLAAKNEPVSFRADIAPVLVQKCQSCHGPKKAKGKYRLDTFARAIQAGAEELLFRVTTDDEDERMPPEGEPLSAGQLAKFKQWVAQGAKYDAEDKDASLASILPALRHPPAPSTYPRPIPLTALEFLPDGNALAVAGYREVILCKVQDGSVLRRIGNLPEKIHAIDFSPDGRWMAVAGGIPGRIGEVRVLDTASGELLEVLHKSDDLCFATEFSPDGSKLATGGADGTVRIFEAPDWKDAVVFSNHSSWVNHVAWHPDGTMVASASRDHTAKVFDLARRKRLSSYTGHDASIYAVQFHPENPDMFTGAGDGRLMRWRIKDSGTVREYVRHAEAVFHLALNPASKRLVSAGGDNVLHSLDWHNPGKRTTHQGSPSVNLCVAVSPDGKLIAAGDRAGRVRIWEAHADKPLLDFSGVVLDDAAE